MNVTVHMIGNAHIDPVWLWRWTEGFETVVATFRSVLDIMRDDPDFRFTSSSAAVYQWLERAEPAMLDEIRQRVAEGRWEIAGGWWMQPDCNIPCGESFARQALHGQRFFKQRLGVTARAGYNVDTFGHAGTLPQLLSKAGLQSYVFFRPDPREKQLPEGMFWWEAPDGTRVLACRPPGHYPYHEDDVAPRVRDHAQQVVRGLNDVPSFYGVGNHGGGPTRAQVAGIRAFGQQSDGTRAIFGRLDRFFDLARAQRQDYPVVREDLQHHARGCYTAHAGIKRWNRECEALLGTAEAFSALASRATGLSYPRADLARAWQNVLFNQFHDILAGSSLPEAYDDARDLYGGARSLASHALLNAVQALARRVDTRGDGQAVIVFNPLPLRARVPIAADFPLSCTHFTAVHRPDGVRVPSQTVQGSALAWSRSVKLLWVDELPALGYRLYFLRPATDALAPAGMLEADERHIENDRWRLTIDPRGGHIASLVDKRRGLQVFSGPAALALVLKDESDTWGHDVVEYRDVAGRFENAEVRVEENGPVCAALRVTSCFGGSRLTQIFRLYRTEDFIEVAAELDWHEQFRMLKLAFPVAARDPVCTSSIPYGHIVRRPTGEEEPCGPWVDVSGEGRDGLPVGVAVVNDSKHGYDCAGAELRLSVLRSPIYAWHNPCKPEPGRTYRFMDQGISEIHYRIIPHAGSWAKAEVPLHGLAVNRAPIIVNEFTHPGQAPREWAGAKTDPRNVVVSALKEAEDGHGLIVRLWETAGQGGEAHLALPHLGAEWRGTMKPNEVKTLLLDAQGRWHETDLLESLPTGGQSGPGGALNPEDIARDPSLATTTARLRSGRQVCLRPLAPGDAQILGDYFMGLSEGTRKLYAPHPFDRETAASLCAKINPASALTLIGTVIEHGKEKVTAYFIIGMGVRQGEVERYKRYGMELDPSTGCMLAPSVADEYQNQGLGSLMMQHVISVTRGLGRKRILLSGGTQCRNVRAIHFYEKHGFVKVGEFLTEVKNQDMVLEL